MSTRDRRHQGECLPAGQNQTLEESLVMEGVRCFKMFRISALFTAAQWPAAARWLTDVLVIPGIPAAEGAVCGETPQRRFHR